MFIADKAATPYPNITQQRTSQQLFCPAHLQNIFFKNADSTVYTMQEAITSLSGH